MNLIAILTTTRDQTRAPCACPKTHPSSEILNHTTLHTTNASISQPLSGSPNYAWLWVTPVRGQSVSLSHTFNIAHLTEQHQLQLLNSLVLTQMGLVSNQSFSRPRIKFTFPFPLSNLNDPVLSHGRKHPSIAYSEAYANFLRTPQGKSCPRAGFSVSILMW